MDFERILASFLRAFRWLVELIGTILYRDMLKRNTLQPMRRIIKEPDAERKRRLLRDWAQTKSNESSYIQLAGGFLFTTVASCLQWPGTANGHWSATALLYASMLIALAAIVTGSQQLLLLPKEKSEDRREVAATAPSLPQQVVLKPVDRIDSEMEESQRQHLKAVVHRICDTDDDHPKFIHVFALQVPIMLLAISVLAFLAAMCSIVFGPLAYQPVWDDNARIAVLFTIVSASCLVIFFGTSFIMHRLFSLQHSEEEL